MRILLLCPYPLRRTPGQRFRFEQYIQPLAQLGYEVDVRPLISRTEMAHLYERGHVAAKGAAVTRGAIRRLRDTLDARRSDLVFIHRAAFSVGPPVFESLLTRLGAPYVFDFDDAIWLPNSSEANRAAAPLKFPRKTESIAESATLVITGNEYLRNWALRFNPNVDVIPTTINTRRYGVRAEPVPPAPVCIGWSGSRTTAQHLAPLGEVLRELQARHGVRLLVVGPDAFSIPGADIEVRPWREETERDDLAEMHVGVMPLPDDEWARGKCGLKALQYMAMGIPTVMSPVGVNTSIAEGGAAALASTPQQWLQELERLILDAQERRRLGAAGRTRVEADYSVEANLGRYTRAFDKAAALAAAG